MRTWKYFLPVLLLASLALPSSVRADPRLFASGVLGQTFQTVPSSNVAGDLGVGLSKHVAVFGEVGHTLDLLPAGDRTAITDNAAEVGDAHGVGLTVDGHVAATEGLGGVRLNANKIGRVTPFAEAGVGLARLTNHEHVVSFDGNDYGSATFANTLAANLPQTDRLILVGGGVNISGPSRLGADIGYRYSRVNVTDASTSALNSGNVYGSVRVRF